VFEPGFSEHHTQENEQDCYVVNVSARNKILIRKKYNTECAKKVIAFGKKKSGANKMTKFLYGEA
jgi:hypothetical protein